MCVLRTMGDQKEEVGFRPRKLQEDFLKEVLLELAQCSSSGASFPAYEAMSGNILLVILGEAALTASEWSQECC